ncbi:hypothetical protein, partial [Pseudomonas aeruginosa]
AGAALVVMGIREETSDLDVDVPTSVFNWASNKFGVIENETVNKRVQYTPLVDLHEYDENTGVVCIEGVWLYSPTELLKQKHWLTKLADRTDVKTQQDHRDIRQLETLTQSQPFTARALL